MPVVAVRSALVTLAATVLAGCTAGGLYTGPVIDAHGHIGASFDKADMERIAEANGVSRMTLMARYYPGPAGAHDLPGRDADALDLAARYPGRFFPLVGMQRPALTPDAEWQNPGPDVRGILADTERKLASGRFYGIGEVIVKHFAYSRGRHAELDHPVDAPLMAALSRIAARFDVPIVLHMEGAPEQAAGLARLLAENRGVRYVWAHNCGRSRAAVIRAMLAAHGNLHCDLAGMYNIAGRSSYGSGWPRMESYTALMEEDGRFEPDMRAIYEDFPDRFVIGSDVAHANVMSERTYTERIDRFRALLGQLPPGTAKKLAETNAIRIFRLDRKPAAPP